MADMTRRTCILAVSISWGGPFSGRPWNKSPAM